MTEYRVWAGDPARAGKRQVESATHAISVNRGDSWRREASDGIHERLSHGSEPKSFGPGECGDLVQVGSGGEEMRFAGDDQPGWRLSRQMRNCVGECSHARDAQAIGAVVRDEAQNRNSFVPFNRAEVGFGVQDWSLTWFCKLRSY